MAVPEVRPPLAELAGAHLAAEHRPGRYARHDLLRAYAAELVHTLDTEHDRRRASRRLLDHYLHTAHAATLLLAPRRRPIALPPPAPGVSAEAIDGAGQALAWFTSERPALVAAVQEAAAQGHDEEVRHLAWALSAFLRWRGLLLDWVTAEQAALDASRRLADPRGQAHALLGRHDRALVYCRRALTLFQELGDLNGQAASLDGLGYAHHHLGQYDLAVRCHRQALGLYLTLGDRIGEVEALIRLGNAHHVGGDHDTARDTWRQALVLLDELAHPDAGQVRAQLADPAPGRAGARLYWSHR
ncbi:tetratricopeptide repeat protein [Nonomuraea sp. FMUSA5-5]|uniref:Tetratricopeptide repeat protein n=1 Tax=Nonomuraea composti TaxID=2720023 RepID=A0ABX1BE35_9ACTN|nr:tetratricopeptide repeat protein [Nonomuraea sp. FMUSA5-5]